MIIIARTGDGGSHAYYTATHQPTALGSETLYVSVPRTFWDEYERVSGRTAELEALFDSAASGNGQFASPR